MKWYTVIYWAKYVTSSVIISESIITAVMEAGVMYSVW
jgi:hypothetical protein